MMFALLYLVVLVSVPLARGRLLALADLPLRWPGVALAAILIQVGVITLIPGGSHALHATLHVLSYLLLGAFALANRRLPGVVVITLGGALNFTAILANGGVMPASARAIASLPHTTARGHFANSQVLAHPRLQILGDIFGTPPRFPVHNVFSIGDILIVLGVAVLAHRASGSRLLPQWTAPVAAVPDGRSAPAAAPAIP